MPEQLTYMNSNTN